MKRIFILFIVICVLLTASACDKTIDFGPDTDERWGDTTTTETTAEPTAPPTAAPTEIPSTAAAVENVTDMALTLNFAFGERTGTYTGEMVNGLPEGSGSFSSANPETEISWVYDGQWVGGHFNGQGSTAFSDGFLAAGTYANDRLNGEGSEIDNGSIRYEGGYSDGDYHGQGTLYNYCDEIIFSGIFNNGYIQESSEARIARVGAFKDSCYEPTFEQLYSDGQNYLSTHVIITGTVLQVFEYTADELFYGDFLLYYQGIDDSSHIVYVNYRLTEGELNVAENQSVTVWGTPVGTFDYTSVEDVDVSAPWVEAWSVE